MGVRSTASPSPQACQIVRTILPKWPLNQVTQSISRFRQREGLSHDRFDRAGLKQRDDRIPGVNPGRLRLSEKYEALDAGQSGIPSSTSRSDREAESYRKPLSTEASRICHSQREARAAVVRNGAPHLSIGARAIRALVQTQGISDLQRIDQTEYAYRLSATGYPLAQGAAGRGNSGP
jgi:hypothetical protein